MLGGEGVCALQQGLAIWFSRCDIRERSRKDGAAGCDADPDRDLRVWGSLCRRQVLTHPRFGAVNLHASLLPKLRGGAPVHKRDHHAWGRGDAACP